MQQSYPYKKPFFEYMTPEKPDIYHAKNCEGIYTSCSLQVELLQ